MKTKIHTVYKTKGGLRVPGVTTITGLLDKSNALIPWAVELTKKGVDWRKYRDDKADIGTLAHDMVVCHLLGVDPCFADYSKNQIDQAENALISYFEWEKSKRIEVIFAERPTVSEKYQYGGTPDIVAYVDGELTLLDLKTGKAIYPEMAIQLAAYEQLIYEVERQIVFNCMILRIGRDETEGFEVKQYTNQQRETAWQIFKHLLKIYQLQKELKNEREHNHSRKADVHTEEAQGAEEPV